MPARARARYAVCAVLLACVTAGCTDQDPAARRRPRGSGSETAKPARASQTKTDAKRDGVPAAIAALPYGQRVNAISTVTVDDDTWVISRPDRNATIEPELAIEYGEVLHLDGRSIEQAFPLPGLPPTHVAVTEDATYCGREGDGGLPDSMVCRIDHDTSAFSVRIFPSKIDSAFADSDRKLPAHWTVDDERLDIHKLVADDAGVWAQAQDDDTWTRLDPDTLEIAERGIERVTTDP